MGNREALLLAAKQCLLDKGYARTTARDIASVAGVSLAAIGYHFSSKDALLTEALLLAFGEWDLEVQKALSASVPADVTPSERFEATWARLIATFETHRSLWIANFEIFTQMVSEPTTRAYVAGNLHTARTGLAALFLNQPESRISEHTAQTIGTDCAVAHRSGQRAFRQRPHGSPAHHSAGLAEEPKSVPAETKTREAQKAVIRKPPAPRRNPGQPHYSERSASTALTLAARAAGTADAMTAAAKMINADTLNESSPGRCTSAT
jgi:AcrR family transcriptional regulator